MIAPFRISLLSEKVFKYFTIYKVFPHLNPKRGKSTIK